MQDHNDTFLTCSGPVFVSHHYFVLSSLLDKQGCGLGLETPQRLVSTENYNVTVSGGWHLGLGYLRPPSRAQDVILPKFFQATLIKWAKSAVAIMAVLIRVGNRSIYLLLTEILGWWSDIMVLTCSFAIASRSKINFNV